MVVTHFQTYIDKIPGVLYSANLRELIQEEPLENRPTIVFDKSAAFGLFQSKKSQPKVLGRSIEDFVDRIISYGANLVVILRGNIASDVQEKRLKDKCLFQRKKKELSFLRKRKTVQSGTIDEIVAEIEENLSKFCFINTLSSISNNHYKVFTSIKLAHEEAAEIATLQNCLAVIGQDSNYIMYEGIRFYVPTSSLNIQTLDCKIYDKKKILEHLALKSYQLPMFATLCGNDVIKIQHLSDFHLKLSPSGQTKFLAIAEIVRKTAENPYKHAKDMVDLIGSTYIDESLITKSLNMYLKFSKETGYEVPKDKLELFADERKKSGEWSCTLHKVFIRKLYGHCFVTVLLDQNLLCSATFLRPLRKKIYGILFLSNESVEEKFWEEMKDKNENSASMYVQGEMPECEHPGLIQLWDKDTPNLTTIKWNLFISSVSRTLSYSLLEFVPPKLLFPLLALHYMKTETPLIFNEMKIFKEEFEVETFLVVGLLVSSDSYDPSEERNHELSGESLLRVSYLSNNFIETCYTLGLLNQACGLVISKTESCICNFYDGVMIRYVYSKMKNGVKSEEFFNGDIDKELLFSKLKALIE